MFRVPKYVDVEFIIIIININAHKLSYNFG